MIFVSENLVVLSCTSSSNGKISIYRDSDMELMFTVTGNSSHTSIGSQISIMETTGYYQVFYNSIDGDGNGELNLIDILLNPNDTSIYYTYETTNLLTDSDYDTFAKYMFLHSSSRMLYIGKHDMSDSSAAETFESLHICLYSEKYSLSEDR